MTNQERAALFQQGIAAICRLEQIYPDYPPFVSIHNQLQFLAEQCGLPVLDRDRLAQINLGYITMREVETRDESIADLLYRCSAEAKAMQARP